MYTNLLVLAIPAKHHSSNYWYCVACASLAVSIILFIIAVKIFKNITRKDVDVLFYCEKVMAECDRAETPPQIQKAKLDFYCNIDKYRGSMYFDACKKSTANYIQAKIDLINSYTDRRIFHTEQNK